MNDVGYKESNVIYVTEVLYYLLMLFIVLFAAQCSNSPGREGLPTVYHPVPTLQWTAQGQGHHTGQEVSTHKENTKYSSITCVYILCTAKTRSYMLVLLPFE